MEESFSCSSASHTAACMEALATGRNGLGLVAMRAGLFDLGIDRSIRIRLWRNVDHASVWCRHSPDASGHDHRFRQVVKFSGKFYSTRRIRCSPLRTWHVDFPRFVAFAPTGKSSYELKAGKSGIFAYADAWSFDIQG